MRLTVRHVYDFGSDRALVGDDLVRPEAWDALRTQTSGPFSMPADRASWEQSALERPDIMGRGEAAADWLSHQRIDSVASYGVGGGSFEFALIRAKPEMTLQITEYAPSTVARLRAIFPEAAPQQHDMLKDAPLDAELHVFHRIDTEFSNREWGKVFAAFRQQRILFIASELLTLRTGAHEILYRMRNSSVTKAGWRRNPAAFEALWRRTHSGRRIPIGDLAAWDLRPKD